MMDLLQIEETEREALGKPRQRAPEVHTVLGTEAWNLTQKNSKLQNLNQTQPGNITLQFGRLGEEEERDGGPLCGWATKSFAKTEQH